eukprot:PhM_4_TR3217/c0_g1_i1/m.102212
MGHRRCGVRDADPARTHHLALDEKLLEEAAVGAERRREGLVAVGVRPQRGVLGGVAELHPPRLLVGHVGVLEGVVAADLLEAALLDALLLAQHRHLLHDGGHVDVLGVHGADHHTALDAVDNDAAALEALLRGHLAKEEHGAGAAGQLARVDPEHVNVVLSGLRSVLELDGRLRAVLGLHNRCRRGALTRKGIGICLLGVCGFLRGDSSGEVAVRALGGAGRGDVVLGLDHSPGRGGCALLLRKAWDHDGGCRRLVLFILFPSDFDGPRDVLAEENGVEVHVVVVLGEVERNGDVVAAEELLQTVVVVVHLGGRDKSLNVVDTVLWLATG